MVRAGVTEEGSISIYLYIQSICLCEATSDKPGHISKYKLVQVQQIHTGL